MTAYYWVGGTGTQSFSDSANWSLTEGGAGGAGPPGNGDTPYITTGTSDISGGDWTSGGTVSFTNLYVSFQGTLGTLGSPLKFALNNNANSIFSGNHGTLYINPVLSSATKKLQLLGTGAVNISGSTGNQGSIVCGLYGPVTIESSYSGDFSASTYGATLTLLTQASISTRVTLAMQGGLIRNYRNFASFNIYKGRGIVYGTANNNGTINVYGPGIYTHNSSGTINNINVQVGGVANTNGATSGFTVTASSVAVNGSIFEQPNVSITYTAATTKEGFV